MQGDPKIVTTKLSNYCVKSYVWQLH